MRAALRRDAHLKVILETGELQTYDNVRRASWLAMLAGGDFIKTSTGKVQPGRDAARHARDARGGAGLPGGHRRIVGVKPAGGIRTAKDAVKYLVMVNEVAGPDWLDPDRFRFGASSLLNDLLMQRAQAAHRPLLRPRLRHPGLRFPDVRDQRHHRGHHAPGPFQPVFDYAPAPESRAVVDLRSSYGLFIGGEFVDPAAGASFKTISPATEEVLAEVAEADDADVDRAIRAARQAYARTWSRMPGRERGKYLFRIARILQERAREFAVLETLDNGKPIRESRDVDVPLAAAHFFYYAGWSDKLGYAFPDATRSRSASRAR